MNKFFGTDGIRFVYDETKLVIVKRLAKALKYFKNKFIIIGGDTRYSSEIIIKTLINNISDKKVIYVGQISTPGICYLSLKHECLGIMVTASHNPYIYNGIKVFKNGLKINNKQIKKLESEMDKIIVDDSLNLNNTLIENNTIKEEYFNFLKQYIKPIKLKCGFDLANGSLSSYGEKLAFLLNKDNQVINNTPNGININEKCGALHPETIKQFVKNNNLDYGFTIDGDADRLIISDGDHIYTGDSILYALSVHFKLKKKTVVLTPYSNLGLLKSLDRNHIKTKIVPSGDENILSYLRKHKLTLGGEDAGHIINLSVLPTGDGFLNALILSRIIDKIPLKSLLEGYTPYPQITKNIKVKNRKILENEIIKNEINRIKNLYKDDIIFHLRFSGTEDLLRIHICHKDENIINIILNKIISLIQIIDNKINVNNYELISIDEKCIFGSNVSLIGTNILKNVTIGNNTIINFSTIENSTIGNDSQIGPFSHIHKNSIIGSNCRIGNYTEIKNSTIGNQTKAAHLCYIGDTTCGNNVNFGCGSITVNYDGKNKNKTIIKDNVFIGCNVNLVAPITIEKNAFIAAGSTITKTLKECDFAIARTRETIKENGAIKYPYYKKNNEL